MNAFISYSLDRADEYIVTLLSFKLRENGFALIMSNSAYNDVDSTVRNQIFISQLFVGLITATGPQWNRVQQEYLIAIQQDVAAILLIEDKVHIDPNFRGNYVLFNRHAPHDAIDEINRRTMPNYQKQPNDALGWILGGAAVAAILGLLAESSKKK